MTVALPHIRVKETAAIVLAVLALAMSQAPAQQGGAAAPTPKPKQKKASELIYKQAPPRIFERVLEKSTPENSSIVISLGKQRAYFLVNGETAIDTPISSGKRAGMTPKGTYKISEKDADHRSSVYGDFVSQRTGKVVRAGVSTKIDSAPSGTVYRGAPMRWFMRLTNDGVGMHTGILPGYPASHGCIGFRKKSPSCSIQRSLSVRLSLSPIRSSFDGRAISC